VYYQKARENKYNIVEIMSKRRGSNDGTAVNSSSNQEEKIPSVQRIKIISMGESGVGKSCVIKRFCEEKFVSKYISTIGIDYGVKPVNIKGEEVRVNFWDLSGLPEFLEVRNEFYKDTQVRTLLLYNSSTYILAYFIHL
jgi:DnaJ family protein C protein 27